MYSQRPFELAIYDTPTKAEKLVSDEENNIPPPLENVIHVHEKGPLFLNWIK